MKKHLLPLMSVMLVLASCLFTGCCPSKLEELLAEIRNIQVGGQQLKTHDLQAEKYIIPNTALAVSQALYVPIGGALSDLVNETVGDEYIRSYLLIQTNGLSYAKVWSAIREKCNDDWMHMTTAERMAFLSNWEGMKKRLNDSTVSNPMTQEQFDAVVNSFSKEEKAYYDFYLEECVMIAKLDLSDPDKSGFLCDPSDIMDARIRMANQIKDIESIPDDLLKFEVVNELVKVKRTQDACVFMDKEEPERLAYYDGQVQEGEGEACVNWLGLNEDHNFSNVYQEHIDRKHEVEEKIRKERADALKGVEEEGEKSEAFGRYWLSVVGKTAYPILAREIPGTAGSILQATAGLADTWFTNNQANLSVKYPWLPSSLSVDATHLSALRAKFGANASLVSVLPNVDALLDQEKLNTLVRVANINFGDWVSIVLGAPDLIQALDYSLSFTSKIKDDLADKDYGQVPLDTIGVLGNEAGNEFVNALAGELKPYQYACEVTAKRIEYTAVALEWLSGNTMEDFFTELSAKAK